MSTAKDPRAPGVYVEEITTLPPSVAEVSTAIPAFIGYTAEGTDEVEVGEIRTLLEYEERFGKATPTEFQVKVENTEPPTITVTLPDAMPKHLLWYALDLYFRNGGGRCYVVSIGKEKDPPSSDDFTNGLGELKKYDEPTLVVMPGIVQLAVNDYLTQVNQSLSHCSSMGDRFAILDVRQKGATSTSSEDSKEFRRFTSPERPHFGAAYYPYLDTTLTHLWDVATVPVTTEQAPNDAKSVRPTSDQTKTIARSLANEIKSAAKNAIEEFEKTDVAKSSCHDVTADYKTIDDDKDTEEALEKSITDRVNAPGDYKPPTKKEMLESGIAAFKVLVGKLKTSLETSDQISTEHENLLIAAGTSPGPRPLSEIKNSPTENNLYNRIKQELDRQRVRLPPSAAIAGVFARTDRERGVWKAPANAGLAAVIAPAVTITAEDQDSLNIDPNAGKSINAIRAFTGKGILVWGARTLAGNDNEWRYVSVRRLFITIEESIQKASAFAVFEPNDATTWLKVKGMIEGYLYGLWEKGALQGAKPESAYYVHVGLGKTMTAQDILEGKLIVEVGVAAVRPAEFIVLKFMHKLAEA